MITLDDLLTRFGEQELARLSDKEHYQQINEDVINRAITDAVSEIKSYLSPAGLADITPSHALTIKACDIARFYLYENGVTEIVQKRYDLAIAWLKEVRRYPNMLTGMQDTTPSSSDTSEAVVQENRVKEKFWEDESW